MSPRTRLAVLTVAVSMLLPTLTEPAGVAMAKKPKLAKLIPGVFKHLGKHHGGPGHGKHKHWPNHWGPGHGKQKHWPKPWWPGHGKHKHWPKPQSAPWWAYVPDINIDLGKSPSAPAYPYPAYPYPAGPSYQPASPYPSYPSYPTVQSTPPVAIERLRGELRSTLTGWSVSLQCEVDIASWNPAEQFVVRMYLTELGNFVYDLDGKPLVVDIPLDKPTSIGQDGLEFREGLTFPLPPGSIHRSGHVRVHAEVVRLSDGQTVDAEEDSLRVRS